MAPPYRKAKGHGWIWILLILAGIGTGIPLAMFTPESVGGWLLLILGLPILTGVLLAAFIDNRLTKGRQARIEAALGGLGVQVVRHPSHEAGTAFFQPIAHLAQTAWLQGGSANLQWIAYGPIQGRQALIFEHMYITGSGKYAQIHETTGVCWVSNEGWLTLLRPRIGEARAFTRHHPELTIGDERFDKDWLIWGEPEAAAAVLTEQFRRGLADSPRGEMWCIGAGFTCCLYRYPLDADNFLRFVSRSGNLVHG